jgi:hypothetical protein
MHLFEGLVQVKTKFGYFNHAFFELPENFIACFFCFDVRRGVTLRTSTVWLYS